MKIENKSQSIMFHGSKLSIEAVDMAEQGFEVMVWGDRGYGQYLANKLTIKGFDALMAFVTATI